MDWHKLFNHNRSSKSKTKENYMASYGPILFFTLSLKQGQRFQSNQLTSAWPLSYDYSPEVP